MSELEKLRDLITETLSNFIAEKRTELTHISPDMANFIDFSEQFVFQGKRFRALLAYWGWASIADHIITPSAVSIRNRTPALLLGASLELFQAAALVHDDLIDNSDIRRGQPSAHRWFENIHTSSDWLGNPEDFGRSSALLLGDLYLSWSEELFNQAMDLIPDLIVRQRTRKEFSTMRSEVTSGQYLDILEEQVWHQYDSADILNRAKTIIIYKSAKYSVVAPLRLGATMNGASPEQVETLSAYGLPLGIAFQLRDDLLGVFGDSEETGKPSGDDLREGKRTVLIALTKSLAQPQVGRLIDELLGQPDLSDAQITLLQNEIQRSGAAERVEKLIEAQLTSASHVLDEANLKEEAVEYLRNMINLVGYRSA